MENKTAKKKVFAEMPHSLEAEQALLGCLLIDTKIQVEIFAYIKEEDFYAESHKYIFNAMSDIVKQNQPIDLVTLLDMLEKNGDLVQAGGISYITKLAEILPSSANYKQYLDVVTRDSMLRKLIRGSTAIIENSRQSTDKGQALGFAEKTIYDISETADTSEMAKIDDVIPGVMNMLDELSTNPAAYRGLKTKFKGVDETLNGLNKSDLIILAARPAVGKTSFAMNIVDSLARQGYSCAVFSLEMSKEQLVQRLLCSVSGVSMSNMLRGKMTKQEWVKISKAKEILSKCKIYIDDSTLITPQQILSKCRRLKNKSGLDFIMIDYIQLMESDKSKRSSDSRQQEVSEISRYLKIIAKEINVPVLALSQLSRAVESRKGRPQLSDLRESGAIEQDADIVMFIHRPDINATEKEKAEGAVKQNVAEIIVAKNRHGKTDVTELYFKGECTKFLNLSETGNPIDDTEDKKPAPVKVTGYEDLPTPPPAEEPVPPVEEAPYDDLADGGEQVVKSVDDEIF